MKLKSKDFRKNRFFILYDYCDNPIMLIDSCKDLIHVYNTRLSDVVRNYNNTEEDYIPVIIDGKKYKLYTFTD